MVINLLDIDIAKNIFQLHDVDRNRKPILKKRLSRDKLTEYIANTPRCTIVMESCEGANYWARVFQRSGHTMKLISPLFVKSFVKTNKMMLKPSPKQPASRPPMHFVPIKQVEQQDIQSLHRIRSRLVKNRTARLNEVRGLNLEYGIVIPTGASKVKTELCLINSDENNELTVASREFMNDLYNELVEIEGKLKNLEKKVKQVCSQNEACCRIN